NEPGPTSPMPYGDGRGGTRRSTREERYLRGNGGTFTAGLSTSIPSPSRRECPICRLPRGELRYGTGHGFTFQISAAYSDMVRSLENFPELATLRMALCAQAFRSAYKAPSCSWA